MRSGSQHRIRLRMSPEDRIELMKAEAVEILDEAVEAMRRLRELAVAVVEMGSE